MKGDNISAHFVGNFMVFSFLQSQKPGIQDNRPVELYLSILSIICARVKLFGWGGETITLTPIFGDYLLFDTARMKRSSQTQWK